MPSILISVEIIYTLNCRRQNKEKLERIKIKLKIILVCGVRNCFSPL